MLTEKIAKLARARSDIVRLENEVALELRKELAALPQTYGFSSVESFCAAVAKATKGKGPAATTKVRKRKRAVVTDETRKQVKALVMAGKTAREIAGEVGVSQPTVQNIKRDLGLVKKKR